MITNLTEKLLRPMVRLVIRATPMVLAVAVALTALAAWAILSLFDIRSDIKDLMPEDTRSVLDTFTIADRLGSINTLKIHIESPPHPWKTHASVRLLEAASAGAAPAPAAAQGDHGAPVLGGDRVYLQNVIDDALHRATLVAVATQLGASLRALEGISYVHYHNDRTFFEDNILHYASVEDLEQLYTDIDAALDEAKREKGERIACYPLCGDEDDDEDDDGGEPGLLERGFDPGEHLDSMENSELSASGEYFLDELPDGGWLITIRVRFRDAATSLQATEAHIERINALIDRLNLPAVDPRLQVVYGGGFETQRDEYNSIRSDITFSGLMTLGSILGLLLLFFRRLRAIFMVIIPLVMSIAWTLALAFLTIGYLNLITAFIFAILLGLGIDFGIHLLARYDEERAMGREPEAALEIAIVEVGGSNVAGGLTTAATFFTLMAADFRGFSQFGLVAGLGVILSLTAMLVVLPAMVIAAHRIWRVKPRTIPAGLMPSTLGRRWPRRVAPLVLVAVLASAALALTRAPAIQFEENFYRLRMRPSEASASATQRYEVANKRHSSPGIALFRNLTEVAAIEKVVQRRRDPQVVRQVRDFGDAYPALLNRLVDAFPTALTLPEGYAAAPVVDLFQRTLPDSLQTSVPKHASYSREATAWRHQLLAFTAAYPHLSARLVDTLGPALAFHEHMAALPLTASLRRWLPASMHDRIPARARSLDLHTIGSVVNVYSFMPGTDEEQRERIEVIDRIRRRIRPARVRFLPREEQEKVQTFYPYVGLDAQGEEERLAPLTVDHLPEWVKLQFKEGGEHPAPPRYTLWQLTQQARERTPGVLEGLQRGLFPAALAYLDDLEPLGEGVDYAFGNVALFYQMTSTLNGMQARQFTDEMRTLHIDGESLTMSNNAFVFADMIRQVQKDGLLVLLIAVGVVLLVVLIQHRSLSQTLIVLSPLLVALCWLIGAMALLNIRLGFFNMVVLPLIIGMGIDDGIHLYHRYRAEGRGSILYTLRHTGGSIFMTSATTSIGFAGMLFSRHMGLNTMGTLAVLGIGAAWLATMLIEPALLMLAERFNWRSVVPAHDWTGRAAAPATARHRSGGGGSALPSE